MRRRFNEGKYYERMKAGEFKPVIVRAKPAEPEILEDYGPETVSVSIWYRDQEDNDIVRVHQYQSPNGEILYRDEHGVLRTDGKPDPKELFEDGILKITQYPGINEGPKVSDRFAAILY